MLIKKSFRVVLSGAYQSFEFKTSIAEDFDIRSEDEEAVKKASEALQSTAVDIVYKDIEAHVMYDPDFKIVMDVRADALKKASKIVK
ncbi:MAG: hypothetical protein WC979_09225 [Candidatus Pacearchaeota archaeon]|jgi:hypothetical protein